MNPSEATHSAAITTAPVLILGRPNVGKSTLFNRLLGQRRSIVGDEPGITRDRIYGEVEWQGRRFELIDTGGLLPGDDAFLPKQIFEQVRAALSESSLVLFVVDARAGVTPVDEELARQLHKWGGRVILLANKADSAAWELHGGEFRRLGFEQCIPISAEQGRGIAELLDAVLAHLPAEEAADSPSEKPEIKVAVIGRPNVGKSSLVNALLGTERVIVSPVPGTTRDAVDTVLHYGGRKFRLIDTAGIRRRSHVEARAEQLSVLMARRHLQRSDVAILLIDAVEGPTSTDATIAAMGDEVGKSVILAVNKWDLVTQQSRRIIGEFEDRVRDRLKFMDYAPIIFISALKGQRVTRLLPLAVKAFEARRRRVPTGELNRFFEKVLSNPRAVDVAKTLRLHYITQADTEPPTFAVFGVAGKGNVSENFSRYLMHQIRDRYGFFATPIRLRIRRR